MGDATKEYFPVADVEVKLDANVCPNELVYLAVYSRDWTITAVLECREDGKVLFRGLKRKMLYLPVVYRDGRAYPIDDLFIIEADGRKRAARSEQVQAGQDVELEEGEEVEQRLRYLFNDLPHNVYKPASSTTAYIHQTDVPA